MIPTGLMAPRLLGQHWDLHCPACGTDFAFGYPPDPSRARCPNCLYMGGDFTSRRGDNVDGGDRVLVLKYLYQFQPPQRWDVVVFLNPQDNRQNYIKRLIGLPGEKIEIVHGDIFASRRIGQTDQWTTPQIQRKSAAQEAMWQMIFDNDYQPDRNYVRPVPGEMSRWNPPQWEFDPRGRWSSADKFGRVLQHEGSRDNLTFSGGRNLFKPNYGYNVPGDGAREIFPENNICTDLKLAMLLLPQAEQARLTLSLTSFDNVFIGEISADGWCKLTVRKEAPLRTTDRSAIVELHKKLPPLGVGHAHRVALTHADLEVTLWVDDQPVIRSEYGMDYQQLVELVRSPNMVPEPRVAISAEGKLQLRHIQLLRDVYYTNPTVDDVSAGPYGEVARVDEVAGGSTPGWGTLGHPIDWLTHRDDLSEPAVWSPRTCLIWTSSSCWATIAPAASTAACGPRPPPR